MDYLNASLSLAITGLTALHCFTDVGILFIVLPFIAQMLLTLLHCQKNQISFRPSLSTFGLAVAFGFEQLTLRVKIQRILLVAQMVFSVIHGRQLFIYNQYVAMTGTVLLIRDETE